MLNKCSEDCVGRRLGVNEGCTQVQGPEGEAKRRSPLHLTEDVAEGERGQVTIVDEGSPHPHGQEQSIRKS